MPKSKGNSSRRGNSEDKNKELEQLKKRLQKSEEKGDTAEEAKLCNAIGEKYSQEGDYRRALCYHQQELSLSEVGGEQVELGIACRKVGECHCFLEDYEQAVQYQKRHLEVATRIGNLAEEQRALATLGRTFYLHSHTELEAKQSKERVTTLLLSAGEHYLRSLEVCDKLVGNLPDRELLEMRSRLYLNLGLVYEDQRDLQSAKRFTEKALGVVEELGDSMTVYQCHFVLGTLHQKERHTSSALDCFKRALAVARELRDRTKEADTLREMAQVYLEQSEFEQSKTCLKRVSKLMKPSKEEEKVLEKQLKVVRLILHYSQQVESKGAGYSREKATLYERLGDLCCDVKAYSPALKFYGKQLTLAEELSFPPKELSPIHVSLAVTFSDYGQFSQSLLYYQKNVQLWKGKDLLEECDCWHSIAQVRESAGQSMEEVMKAYRRAANLAEKAATQPKKRLSVYKAIVKYISGQKDSSGSSHNWKQKISRLLETYPSLANEEEEEEESEDSQDVIQSLCENAPDEALFSPSSSEGEEGEEEEGGVGAAKGTVQRRRSTRNAAMSSISKLEKKNERGESLLQVAVINGDLGKAKTLISKGAQVNTRDNCGWTPLHESCNYGNLELTRLLLDNQARIDDPGGRKCDGVTPLMDAASNGHEDVVRLLVEKGADLAMKDVKGRTTLDLVSERLQNGPEEGSVYELEEEHRSIWQFLASEMRRHGLHVDKTAASRPRGTKGKGKERRGVQLRKGRQSYQSGPVCSSGVEGSKGALSSSSGSSSSCNGTRRKGGTAASSGSSSGGGGGRSVRLPSGCNRWGDDALYYSGDESAGDSSGEEVGRVKRTASRGLVNPGAPFTTRTVAVDSPTSSVNGGRRRTQPVVTKNSVRFLFDSPEQLEAPLAPALLPEEPVEGVVDEDSGCPVVDNWLVDDLSGSPSAKRRRIPRDQAVERESRALLGLPAGASGKPTQPKPVARPRSGRCPESKTFGTPGRENCPEAFNEYHEPASRILATSGRPETSTFWSPGRGVRGCPEQSTSRGPRKGAIGVAEQGRRSMTTAKRPRPLVAESDSDEEFEEWKRKKHGEIGSTKRGHRPPGGELHWATTSNPVQPSPPVHYSPSHLDPPCSLPTVAPPLRVKVQIESHSYRIPCPAKVGNKDTPISWLIAQASKRYFSQRGKRPVLELTTMDGASLFEADPIAHVLSQDEEVVGVVKDWVCPPLAERYQIACRVAGVGCNTKALQLFELESGQASSLDLSDFDLQPRDSTPLFQALHSERTLTSLTLSGNKLRDESVSQLRLALEQLPALRVLELSATGITHQGLDLLVPENSCPSGFLQDLEVLNLSHSKLGVAGGCGLSRLLRQCDGLQDLYLDSCGLCGEVLEATAGADLGNALAGLSDLRVLSLGKNPLGVAGLLVLFQTLTGLKVTSLNISRATGAKLSDSRVFSRVLQEETTLACFRMGGGQYLECLDVSHCGRGDSEAVLSLVHCLETCYQLRELKLAGWGLTQEILEPLCSYVTHADNLRYLDVSGNVSLGNSGALQLLLACGSRGVGSEEVEGGGQASINLRACGIESPLSNQFVRVVQQLHGISGVTDATFKVDLIGNLVDNGDMELLALCNF